jgi:hypothetical protein
MSITFAAFRENAKQHAEAREKASHPIICKTTEEKDRLIAEWDKKEEEVKKRDLFMRLFSSAYLPSPFYRPDIFTEDEHLERNKNDDFYPELLPRFFVSAKGSDRNDGLSAASPFKTLKRALQAVANNEIKRIEIQDALSSKTEGRSFSHYAFEALDTGGDEITICGKISRDIAAFRQAYRQETQKKLCTFIQPKSEAGFGCEISTSREEKKAELF